MQPRISAPPSAPGDFLAHSRRADAAKIAQGAKDFEGLLIGQMLRSAREAGNGGFTGGGADEDEANSTLVELGEQQLAQALANSGTLGIAKIVTVGLAQNAD